MLLPSVVLKQCGVIPFFSQPGVHLSGVQQGQVGCSPCVSSRLGSGSRAVDQQLQGKGPDPRHEQLEQRGATSHMQKQKQEAHAPGTYKPLVLGIFFRRAWLIPPIAQILTGYR